MMQTNPRIYIVDDQVENLTLIKRIFQDAGCPYLLTLLPEASMVLTMLETDPLPDLIITDWEMPSMDGIALIQAIHRSPRFSNIPVIMCTGIMTSSEHLQTALEAGAFDYIRKPVDPLELLARTQAVVAHSRSRQQIIAQNRELEKLVATRDRFFSIIAHDMKAPLNTVLSAGELLSEDLKSQQYDQVEELLELLLEGVRQGRKLLENLLSWARVQTGLMHFNPQLLHFDELVDEVIGLYQTMAREKHIRLSVRALSKEPIKADQDMCRLILRNLIQNAIKFTQEGGEVTLETQNVDGYFVLSISDTGTGMLQHQINGLFDITQNHSTKGTNNETGTGLGLILCKEFVDLHGGKFEVESVAAQGSTFRVLFPLEA